MMPVIQTVLGTIEPNLLGRTLTHEHIGMDFEGLHCTPPDEFQSILQGKITLETLGYVRQYPYSSFENVRFYDQEARDATTKDIHLYKKFGGDSIVDNSSHGMKRNLENMVATAKETGVNIVAGTGHYIHTVQDKDHTNMTVEQMTDLYTKEIITGVDVEGIGPVKCGFICVGSVFPLHEFEKRSIRATGEIQEALGCGVSMHPGRAAAAPFEIMRIYLEAGGRADKCVMSHLDRTIFDYAQLLEFAKFGCFLQYDLFGIECSYYQLNSIVDMPSDAQRINTIIKLVGDGLVDKVLMSHDIHTKHRLTSFGGHGYHHINMNILPRIFANGLSVGEVDQIIVKNPKNWLEFTV